jgi:hypothetical protein
MTNADMRIGVLVDPSGPRVPVGDVPFAPGRVNAVGWTADQRLESQEVREIVQRCVIRDRMAVQEKIDHQKLPRNQRRKKVQGMNDITNNRVRPEIRGPPTFVRLGIFNGNMDHIHPRLSARIGVSTAKPGIGLEIRPPS